MSPENVAGARILVLEPWKGGSHAQFLEQWREHSRHELEIVGLSPHHWRWRMRSAPWQLARSLQDVAPPQVLFVSDYLDLPSFLGLMPAAWSKIPTVVYFHENQATYPLAPDAKESERERDYHLAWSNLATALRADRIVFNSAFHRAEFQSSFRSLLERWPKPNPRTELDALISNARVIPPGVSLAEIPCGAGAPADRPLRVLFNQRWEHDKDPEWLLRAFVRAKAAGLDFELCLLGERSKSQPAAWAELSQTLHDHILQSEFATDRESYARTLGTCDLVVSAARHEFFGIAVVEAFAAGCTPLLPDRLAYPELVGSDSSALYADERVFDAAFAAYCADPNSLRNPEFRAEQRQLAARFDAPRVAAELDAVCAELVGSRD